MKKDLFAKVLNNKLLFKEIFNNVRLIHKNKKRVFKYNDIINNTKLLASHKYFSLSKKYYERNPKIEENSIRPTLIKAIKVGALDILKYYFVTLKLEMIHFTQRFRDSDRDLMYYATHYNQWDIICYLYSFEINHNYQKFYKESQFNSGLLYIPWQWNYIESLCAASSINNLKILKFMSDHVPQIIDWTDSRSRRMECPFEEAATHGCLSVVKWLVENRPHEVKYTHMYKGAVCNGHLDVVQYLFEKGIKYQPRNNEQPLLDIAIEYNQFNILKYLYENGFKINPSTALNNAFCNFEMLEWLNVNIPHLRCTTKLMNGAVQSNNLKMVKWLHFNRTEGCDGNMIELAAWNGNLEMVEFLHNNQINMKCSFRAIDHAAEKGHLEILQWLHHNRTEGCSTNAMDNAAKNGHLEIINWLHYNLTTGCTTNAMNYAAEYGHLEIIKWLHHNRTEGCTTAAMNNAAANGHLEIVNWLHLNRTEGCTTNAMDFAAKNGHLETIKWLHENRTEGCTIYAIDNTPSLEITKWLFEHRTEGCSFYALDYLGYKEKNQWLIDNNKVHQPFSICNFFKTK